MSSLPPIDPQKEFEKIRTFIKRTLNTQKIKKAVIGVSGGIDSSLALTLLTKSLPKDHIYPVHLYYYPNSKKKAKIIMNWLKIPRSNISFISIKKPVDQLKQILHIDDELRLGNIMARIRMIMLFDFAKKHNALVCGTENKSEHLLGYFTRFGDAASDIEPIQYLYKTQILHLSKFLNIPAVIINQPPSADLWKDQTDEKEFGFTYEEADQVLYLYFDKKMKTNAIIDKGLKNASKIIQKMNKNQYKHMTPYTIR